MDRKGNDTKSAIGQHARFIETARQLGCDEDGAAFDEKLKVVVKPNLKTSARSA